MTPPELKALRKQLVQFSAHLGGFQYVIGDLIQCIHKVELALEANNSTPKKEEKQTEVTG